MRRSIRLITLMILHSRRTARRHRTTAHCGRRSRLRTTRPITTNQFRSGRFRHTAEIPLGTSSYFITNNGTLTINGPGAKLLSSQWSQFSFAIFNVTAGSTVAISGLTIRNGWTLGGGGGIRNAGNLTVNSCEIKFNRGRNT